MRAVAFAVTFLFVRAALLSAQGVELAPYGGYRFGNGLFENLVGGPLDVDGAPALGIVVDVPVMDRVQIEASYSHQRADALVPTVFGQPARWRIAVDQWQGGALQEFSGFGQGIRPFLTGILGLTRYAAEGDSEIRFTAGAGGGVKLFPASHVGVRLEGRVFATLIDAAGNALACVGGAGCLVALHLDVAWQAELTAGVVVKLPRSRMPKGR